MPEVYEKAEKEYGTFSPADHTLIATALKDFTTSYKGIRDYKTGNLNAVSIPHRIGPSLTKTFSTKAWPIWYASVAIENTSQKSPANAGKRRMIFEIQNCGDAKGLLLKLIFTPSHYGDNPRKDQPNFSLVTNHPWAPTSTVLGHA